jgi:hypothetical protein
LQCVKGSRTYGARPEPANQICGDEICEDLELRLRKRRTEYKSNRGKRGETWQA